LVAEPQSLQRAGAIILDHDVAGANEFAPGEPPRLGLEIERHALLVAVHGLEERVVEAAPAAKGITVAGRLDLDDLRAEIGQQHAGVWPAYVARELNDAYAGQCSGFHCPLRPF